MHIRIEINLSVCWFVFNHRNMKHIPVDPRLIEAAKLGSASAFDELVTPFLHQLHGWLSYLLDTEADDCLQEVLFAAWLRLPSLREPDRFGAWLFQITRNQYLDTLRRKKRKNEAEVPLEKVEGYLSRQSDFSKDRSMAEWLDALPKSERAAIWLFYVEEWSVKEIAKQRSISTGTVKRLLFNGRLRIRNSIIQEGENHMSNQHRVLLPELRPEIQIHPLTGTSFSVDFLEGPWYFTELREGSQTQWAIYDPPTWQRAYVYDMHVQGKAFVHGLECFEVRGDEFEDGKWKEDAFRHFTQITDQSIQYLAVLSHRGGTPHLDTFLDESFQNDWGQKIARGWKAEGRFQGQENDLITIDKSKSGGLGFYEVRVGKRTFRCLRVIDTTHASSSEGTLVEAYLSQEGRTVLFRRYNGMNWRPNSDWLKQCEGNQHLTLDGVEFVHWYDCISEYAL